MRFPTREEEKERENERDGGTSCAKFPTSPKLQSRTAIGNVSPAKWKKGHRNRRGYSYIINLYVLLRLNHLSKKEQTMEIIEDFHFVCGKHLGRHICVRILININYEKFLFLLLLFFFFVIFTNLVGVGNLISFLSVLLFLIFASLLP